LPNMFWISKTEIWIKTAPNRVERPTAGAGGFQVMGLKWHILCSQCIFNISLLVFRLLRNTY